MDNIKPLEQFSVEIGIANKEDASAISSLQKENLVGNVSAKDRQEQGFVSVETSPELLEEIINNEGITVARAKGKIVGYLIPMTVEHTQRQVSILDPFLARLKSLQLENKPLSEYRYCILTQVCVDKNYRGQGILEKMYAELKSRLAPNYDLAMSEISSSNPRSLSAHLNKVGLRIVEEYSSDGKDWKIVILDLRPSKK